MLFRNRSIAASGKLLKVVSSFFLANALDASGNLCAQVLGSITKGVNEVLSVCA